jgi:hypothetical protein
VTRLSGLDNQRVFCDNQREQFSGRETSQPGESRRPEPQEGAMQNQYSIRILDAPGGTVVFWPWVPGAKAGDPLTVQANDIVTWNNMSVSTVTLQSLSAGVTFITNPIPSGQVCSPGFQVPSTGLNYQTSTGVKHSIDVPSASV